VQEVLDILAERGLSLGLDEQGQPRLIGSDQEKTPAVLGAVEAYRGEILAHIKEVGPAPEPDLEGDAMELLRVLRMVRRCEVRAGGDCLKVRPTADPLTAEDREAIVRLKPAILSVLAEQERVLGIAAKTDWTDYRR